MTPQKSDLPAEGFFRVRSVKVRIINLVFGDFKMRHFVLAVSVLCLGMIGFAGLSNASVQTSHKTGDLSAWAQFNTSSNTWSKKTVSIKAENNEWTLFNTSTNHWNTDGEILPEIKHGLGFQKTVKAVTTNKRFN